jgi:O-antigen/teichoic acid export membrane protein
MIRRFGEELKLIRASFENRNGFLRNSMTLTIGTSISQLIPILFSPVLTRLFSPSEFGILAVVSSITLIISVVSTGKYETIILIAKNNRDAANIAILALLISLIVSLASLLLFLFFSDTIINILNQPRLEHWIFVCPLMSFLISIYQVYNEWCIRKSQFKNLATNKIINSGAITASNLLFGFLRISSGGLIYGELLGRFISALSCTYYATKRDFHEFRSSQFSRMIELGKQYLSAPRFILPGQLLNTFAGQIVILLIAGFFSDVEVGYYSMTVMVLSVPASLISLTIRDVFRQKANEEYQKNKNCRDIYLKTLKAVSAISLIIFTGLFFILPGLFAFVFGENWRTAGEYARILSPTIMISFIAESVWGMFIVAEKMRAVLIWQIQFFAFTLLSMILGYYFFGDIESTLICFAVGRSLVYFISLKWTYQFARGNEP